MQDVRYKDRVTRTLDVDPELHDALVPAMFLQPIVENAYSHGVSKVDHADVSIEVRKDGQHLLARVTNSGKGLRTCPGDDGGRRGVGLSNIRNRLLLHFGSNAAFSIRETDPCHVEVAVSFPLQIAANAGHQLTRYGIS